MGQNLGAVIVFFSTSLSESHALSSHATAHSTHLLLGHHSHGLHRCHLLHALDLGRIDNTHGVDHLELLDLLSELQSTEV